MARSNLVTEVFSIKERATVECENCESNLVTEVFLSKSVKTVNF